MKGYDLTIRLYAESAEEVQDAERAVANFIEEHRKEGRAVTARKIADAVTRWRVNPFVKSQIINYFSS